MPTMEPYGNQVPMTRDLTPAQTMKGTSRGYFVSCSDFIQNWELNSAAVIKHDRDYYSGKLLSLGYIHEDTSHGASGY